MRVKSSQFEALAKHVIKQLHQKKLATFQKTDEELTELIVGLFQKNAAEEEKLIDDAKKLLEQNKKKIGLNIDEERALSMIKKQLAKERNFVL
ncbi:MAG: DUF507 family protein [Deltaproteobacteria bacterium]|nr:DUF507 family protein [Deltaproteobacteria bacterium]